MHLVCTNPTCQVAEVALELCLQPQPSLGSTVNLNEGPDVPLIDLDLGGAVRREGWLPVAAVVGADLVLADPTQPAMDLANPGLESDVEVVDGERVVDMEKAAAGSSRSKTQDFPIDPRELSGGDAICRGQSSQEPGGSAKTNWPARGRPERYLWGIELGSGGSVRRKDPGGLGG